MIENIVLLIILILAICLLYTKFNLNKIFENFQTTTTTTTTTTLPKTIASYQNNFDSKVESLDDKIDEIDEKYKQSKYSSSKFDTSFVDTLKNRFNFMNDIRNSTVNTNINYNKDVMKELDENISDLETSLNILPEVKNPLTGVRSLQNGMKMGVSLNKNNNYKVHLNGGCLNDKGNLNYHVNTCSDDKKTQEFNILNIQSDGFYNAILEPSLDKVRDSDSIEYPFYVIKSKNSDRCLQNNFGKLTIQPCMVKKSQRWKKIDNYKCA